MKFLRVFHVLTASIWFGGVVCIGVLTWICYFSLNESAFLVLAPIVPTLYSSIIAPVALLTIAQGIIYGLSTDWGFVKHKWIIFKWLSV